VLGTIDRVEKLVHGVLAPNTIRCRVRRNAVVVELDAQSLAALDAGTANSLQQQIGRLLAAVGVDHPVCFQPYRMGSAFLRPVDDR
jgi:uncharacterized protein